MILAAPSEIRIPTGTKTPTEPAREGTRTKSAIINKTGTIETFQFLLMYTNPNAPKSEERILSNAGFNVSLERRGWRGTKQNTPIAMMIVVTIDAVAIAIVEMSSPSSVFGFIPALSIAFNAAGTFKAVTFPVTKLKYVPLVPSIGVKVMISITPTVQ